MQGMFTSCSRGESLPCCGARALDLGICYDCVSACSDCASVSVVYATYRGGVRADRCASASRGGGVYGPGSETLGVYAGRGYPHGLASVSRAWSCGFLPVAPGLQLCVLQVHRSRSCGSHLGRSAAARRSRARLPGCTQLTCVPGAGRSVSLVHQRTVRTLRTIRRSSTWSLLACRFRLGVWSPRLRRAAYGSRVCLHYLRLVLAGTS